MKALIADAKRLWWQTGCELFEQEGVVQTLREDSLSKRVIVTDEGVLPRKFIKKC